MQDKSEVTSPLAITFLEEQSTEPEDTTPAPEASTLEDILENLDIGEAQATEKAAIDKVVSATLASIDELDWPTDLDELGEAETEKLVRASEGEDEKEETMEKQPPTNISGAPSQFVGIRTMEEARNASLKSLAATAALKLVRRRNTPAGHPCQQPQPSGTCQLVTGCGPASGYLVLNFFP